MFQILVVEDDADLQNLFCKTLIRNNYQAYGAKNVQHALNICLLYTSDAADE